MTTTDDPITITVDIAEVKRCIALSDEKLRKVAIKGLETYLLWSPLLVLTAKRKPGIVRRVFIEYEKLKKGAQKQVGTVLVSPLQLNGGNRICDEYDYCKEKAELLDKIKNVTENPELVVAATELSESLDWLVDVIREILEIIGDTAIPISFIILSIKEGFDDLCNCCEECDGSGCLENGEPCNACGGTGVKA